jgi:glycosyltransferase involved in cell wall biosynthesis
MRILLVSDYGTPTGGAEIQFVGLREELRKRGHDARWFTTSARPNGAQSLSDAACFGTTSRFRTLLQTANPWAWAGLRRVMAEFRPDVVHVKIFLTQLSPLILPLLRQTPSLYHVVWYRPVCPTGTKILPNGAACRHSPGVACLRSGCLPAHDWAPLMLQMKLWRRWRDVFDLIVANSHATKQRLLAEGIEPVDVLWNGVPPRAMRPPLPSQPTVVFAGRLVWEKGIDVLLHAFSQIRRQIPAARLLIAGEGPERANLETLVATLGLRESVTLLGRLPRAQLEHVCEGAWVQVVPSRWDEPFGIVAAEASMRGTAVIASSSGGLAEIVQDGRTGYLTPPGEEGPLADALRKLLSDRDEAERMGCAGREVALTSFNETLVADQFLERYRNISQGSGVRGQGSGVRGQGSGKREQEMTDHRQPTTGN